MEDINENPYLLASRWSRIGATIVDSLILSVVMLPLAYFTGAFDGLSNNPPTELPLTYQLTMAILGFSLYCIINWKYLKLSGQTVGKKLLGIKMVNLDGTPAQVFDLVFKRYAFFIFVGYIPLVGGWIGLVNMLMVFGKQKRALHDRIAKTKVIVS